MESKPAPSNRQYRRVPDEKAVPRPQTLDAFSGGRAPGVICPRTGATIDILLDSYHDLTKPTSKQMVCDILETADASLWAIDGCTLTNPRSAFRRRASCGRGATSEVRLV